MLSIIVPIYNALIYIDKVINSVINQSFCDWELILVDDGSTDGSEKICDKYAKVDERIVVIHQINSGVSAARNRGIDIAQGEYIMFIDADDYVTPDYCETVMRYANGADIVIVGYTKMTKSEKKTISIDSINIPFSRIGELFSELYVKQLSNAPWAKLYKRSLIGSQRFDQKVVLGEDLLFNLKYLPKCNTIQTVDYSGYMYNCLNENAATKKVRESDCKQIIDLYKATKTFSNLYCRGTEKTVVLEENLCITGLYLIQAIYYSDRKRQLKCKMVRELMESSEFLNCCNLNYDFGLIQRLPQKLVRIKSMRLLELFYKLKKCLKIFGKNS